MGGLSTESGVGSKLRFADREEIVSSVGICLKVAEAPVGVMFLNYRTPHSFDEERRELIEAFGTQVALSLETAALYGQIRESATREEATTLAHELHDVVAVLATGVVSKAGTILDRLKGQRYSKRRLREDLRSVEKYGGSCIAELREMVGELREPGAEANSWPELLKNHLSGLESPDLRVSLDLDAIPKVPLTMNRHLYLIVRELFNNVLTHAKASRVSIHAENHDGRLSVTVQDDGIGFDPADIHEQKPSSLGLLGVRRRVAVLKGTLEIDSRPNGGTIVIVDVPVPAAALGPVVPELATISH
jgi:signal transduction histidine kinase